MFNYTVRRLISAIPVLFIVAVMVFALIHMIPGNPAAVMLGSDATQEEIDALSEKLGLNEPVPVQLVKCHAAFRQTAGHGNNFTVCQSLPENAPCFRFLRQGNKTKQLAAVPVIRTFQKPAAKPLFPCGFFFRRHCFAAATHFLPESLFCRNLLNHRE